MLNKKFLLAALPLTVLLAACGQQEGNSASDTGGTTKVSILNVSYDPTRELYREYNAYFSQKWQAEHQQQVEIQQSNGGSGKQALAVRNGLKADVVTLALAGDIDSLNADGKNLLQSDWQQVLPENSTPYTSTIVFVVRKGNPKNIRDWGDLVQGDVKVITPNPKTSGGARWNFLGAWVYALSRPGGNEESAKSFVSELYRRVPVMDSGARAATVTFTQRQLGDVLLTWENEAHLAVQESGGQLEIVVPSISVLCEPPVAVVDANVDAKGTRSVAEGYLKGLYDEPVQRLIAKNFYRPRHPAVLEEFRQQFPEIKLVGIQELGGWQAVQPRFFNDGGVFDQIYQPKP